MVNKPCFNCETLFVHLDNCIGLTGYYLEYKIVTKVKMYNYYLCYVMTYGEGNNDHRYF